MTIRKNLSNIIIGAIALTILLVPEAKAFVHQGLMKVGFFQPKLEKTAEIQLVKPDPAALQFEVINSEGETLKIADLHGKVVFINFWATWCPPCIAEMGSLQVLYDKFKEDSDVQIIMLEVEGKEDKVKQFMKRKGYDLPVFYPNSAVPQEFFKGTLPTTVILDKQGNIAHTTLGMADYSGQGIVDFLNMLKEMH